MRHRKHNHQLGVKTAHRSSLLANLSSSLIESGRIKTTLAKARALRPSIEKVITLAKKAHATSDTSQKVHYRRLAIARIRNKKAVQKLFDELVEQFVGRNGGYTRIYKLALPRLGDAAEMALIEFVEVVPKKKSKKRKSTATKKSKELKETVAPEKSEEAESVSKEEEVSETTVADLPDSGEEDSVENDQSVSTTEDLNEEAVFSEKEEVQANDKSDKSDKPGVEKIVLGGNLWIVCFLIIA